MAKLTKEQQLELESLQNEVISLKAEIATINQFRKDLQTFLRLPDDTQDKFETLENEIRDINVEDAVNELLRNATVDITV